MAAARAPAIAAARLSDLFVSDELGLLAEEASDPGFRENGFRESGRGNFTGSGGVTGVRPLTAASYTFTNLKWNNRLVGETGNSRIEIVGNRNKNGDENRRK